MTMNTLEKIYKKFPSYMLFVMLACVYLTCGFIFGYHTGYKSGQKDYIIHIEKILEDVKSNHDVEEKSQSSN